MERKKTKIIRPIVLIGMMGAGKTTVGEKLANNLDLSWVDTDQSIEMTSGQDIPEIFEIYGEPYFRQLESEALAYAMTHAQVISSGGGLITVAQNRQQLKKAYVIYLKATIETLVGRLSVTQRPLLQNVDVYGKLADLLAARESTYDGCANLTITTDDLTADEVAIKIKNALSCEL